MCGTLGNVQTLQQPRQFSTLYVDNIGLIFRPVKSLLFQPFMPKAEPVSVPIKNFNDIPLPVAETKQVPRQGIERQLLGNHNGKTIYRLTHIGCSGGNVNLVRKSWKKHYRFSNTVSSLLKVVGEKLFPTATDIFPGRMICSSVWLCCSLCRINALDRVTGTSIVLLLLGLESLCFQ